MNLLSSLLLLGGFVSSAVAGPCHANNCARAVTGTRLGPSQVSIASADCVSFLGAAITVTPLAHTVTITATVISGLTIAKRQGTVTQQLASKSIPAYATDACKDFAAYSSACSCFGVIGTTQTLSVSNYTVTTTVTSTKTYSNTTSPATPTCTANVLTDPLNCGQCGRVCPSGKCHNGACSSTQCANNQTCDGGFKTCSGSTCFCFSDYTGAGFCGQNAICSGSTSCATDKDCSSGKICATKTCCPAPSQDKPGICLIGECANPANKLIRMASVIERNHEGRDTAAFRGHLD